MLVVQPGRRALQLRHQIAEVAGQDDAGHRGQEAAIRLGHPVGAQQEHASRLSEPAGPGRLLHEPGQQVLHLVEIVRRMLVQDDDVGAQPLDAPVLLRVEQLAHERQRRHLGDAQEHDRQVAGDAVAPQVLLTERVAARDRPG